MGGWGPPRDHLWATRIDAEEVVKWKESLGGRRSRTREEGNDEKDRIRQHQPSARSLLEPNAIHWRDRRLSYRERK